MLSHSIEIPCRNPHSKGVARGVAVAVALADIAPPGGLLGRMRWQWRQRCGGEVCGGIGGKFGGGSGGWGRRV